MILTSARWGVGPGIAEFVLAGAEVALRMLLPPRHPDETPASWTSLARHSDRDVSIDASTSWTALTELDGAGGPERPAWSHPEGRLSIAAASKLVELLSDWVGHDRWRYVENADRGGMWSRLAPAGEISPEQLTGVVKPAEIHGRLSDLADLWTTEGFHGRAWDASALVGLAADSYADSLVISGPRALAPLLTASDLEVFALPMSAANPITTA